MPRTAMMTTDFKGGTACFSRRLRTVIAVCLIAAAAVTTVVFAVSETAVRTDGIKVPILMYHSILKDPARSGKFVITPAELEDDLNI